MSARNEPLHRETVARRELDAAIYNFFFRDDLVATHLLGWAALDIISDVAKARGVATLRTKMARRMEDGVRRAWAKAERDHYNFMKHADRDPERIVRLLPGMTAFAIYTACRDFLAVFGSNTATMAIFVGWYLNRNPDMAAAFDAEYRDLVDEFGPTEETAWAEALKLLGVALEYPELIQPA